MSQGYINTIYDEVSHPLTDYPAKLCSYLATRFGFQHGQRLLEPGCGRCEFLKAFARIGLETHGCDICTDAGEYAEECSLTHADIEKNGLPYPDEYFDIIFSKSFVEHLAAPVAYFEEALRVLKKNGVILTLVPDWESCYKIYFDDPTHKTPFTTVTLKDCYQLAGFSEIYVEKFHQLPIVWRYPVLKCLCASTAPFTPVRVKNKFLRWSRELMVLGIAKKLP